MDAMQPASAVHSATLQIDDDAQENRQYPDEIQARRHGSNSTTTGSAVETM